MKTKILITSFVKNYFKKEKDQIMLINEINHKVLAFINNNYFRIKAINLKAKLVEQKFYEMKLYVNQRNYRIAFYEINEKVIVCYISNNLIKNIFDNEFNNWLNKNFNAIKI